MTLTANTQEYNALKEYLPLDTQVVSAEELGTDFVVNGLEKSRMYERKELKDFLASIHDGRIFEQLKDLSNNKNAYEPFIILEGLGFYDWTVKKWKSLADYFGEHPERKMSFFEALTTFRAFGVGLVITLDKIDTALFLTHQNIKLGKPKEKKEFPERRGFRKDWDNEKKKQYLFEAFGPTTGKALLREYRSPAGMITMLISLHASKGDYEWSEVLRRGEVVADIANIKLSSGRRIGTAKATEIFQVLFS
jgi:ERCC4-type nuclease